MQVGLNDIEELNELDTGWDIDFAQVDRGALQGSIKLLTTDKTQVTRVRFGRTIRQKGASPKGYVSFALLAEPSIELKWCGREVDGSQLMVFPVEEEFECVSYRGFDVFTFTLEQKLLLQAMDRAGLDAFRAATKGGESLTLPPKDLKDILARLMGLGRGLPDKAVVSDIHDHWFQRQIVEIALDGLASGLPHTKPLAKFRDDAVRRAESYLHENLNRELNLDQLCAAVGSSARTLQYGFKEYFGLSPMKYLKAMRLSQVRRELRKASPDSVNIAKLASKWGFWHMSQFAQDYRKHFGELPSETLSRNLASEMQ